MRKMQQLFFLQENNLGNLGIRLYAQKQHIFCFLNVIFIKKQFGLGLAQLNGRPNQKNALYFFLKK